MATEAQIEANRRNAEKSTGPKTLNELRKVQAARKAEEASGGKTNSAAEPHSPMPAESESPEHTTPACDHNSDCAKQTQSAPARHDAKLTVSRTCDDKPLVVKVQNKPNQSQSASQPEPCESAESEIATALRASQ